MTSTQAPTPHHPNPSPPESLRNEHRKTDTTLDNESAVIAEAAAEATAAKAAAAAPVVEAAPEVTPEPVVEAKPDPVAAAIAENAAATRALAEKLAERQQPEATTTVVTETPRDYAAELAAAKQAYEDGDLTQDAYDAQRDDIIEARLEAKVEAKLTAQREADAAERAKQTEQQAEQAWQAAQGKFFADPGNAKLVEGNIAKAGFGAAVQEAFAEHGNTKSYDELLVIAREKITGVAAIDPNKAIKDAEAKRQLEARTTPAQTLREVPNSGDNDSTPGSALDNLGISELEDALFQMSSAERARYLADAPGGLRDNPRQTS
jgi:hypothetical protein